MFADGVQFGAWPRVEGGPQPCDRCGTFAELSWTWGKRLCAECEQRQHAALRTPRKAWTLIKETIRLLPAIGPQGVLVALLPLPFTLALRSVRPQPDTGDVRKDTLLDLGPSALLAPFSGVAVAVLTCVLLQVLVEGAKPDYAAAWRQVRKRLAAVIGLAITLSLVEDFAMLILKYLGMLLVSLPLALAYPALLNEGVSVPSAVRRSAFRMQGNYTSLVGAWLILEGVVMLPVALALFGMSLGLEGRGYDWASAAFEGAVEVFTLPMTIATVLYYVKLPPRVQLPTPSGSAEPG